MGKDSSEIRREIEETRARMGDTVEALSYKADVPNRMKDAVNDKVETVKGTIGDVVSNVKDAVSGASGKVGSALGGAKDKAGTTWSDTSDKLGDTVGGVGDTLGGVTGKLGDVTGKLGDVTGGITDKLGAVTDKLPRPGDVTGAAKRGVGMALENPLGLAIGAAAVGFLAGLMMPVTDYERDTIGPIRDDLVDKAQQIGSDALEHGKAVLQETAQAALSTAQQSAQTHGQQVVQNVQNQNGGDQGSSGGGLSDSGDSALSSAGMPSDASQGGGLRDETLMSGGTGSQTSSDTGKTSSEYGVLLDDDTLKPGSPGTASP